MLQGVIGALRGKVLHSQFARWSTEFTSELQQSGYKIVNFGGFLSSAKDMGAEGMFLLWLVASVTENSVIEVRCHHAEKGYAVCLIDPGTMVEVLGSHCRSAIDEMTGGRRTMLLA